jgi:uncharacterized protein YndB with AHSA1/START domain
VRTIEAIASTPASRERVWTLLADASAWAQWGSWSEVDVEGGGPQGLGAERVLVRRPFRTRERITEWVPNERLGYEVLDGLRVRGYRSTVTLEDASQDGTTIRWVSTYEHAGPFTALLLRTAVKDACKRLARAASVQT